MEMIFHGECNHILPVSIIHNNYITLMRLRPNLKCDSYIITNSLDVGYGQTRSFYNIMKNGIRTFNSHLLTHFFSLLVFALSVLSPWPAPLNGVTEKLYT